MQDQRIFGPLALLRDLAPIRASGQDVTYTCKALLGKLQRQQKAQLGCLGCNQFLDKSVTTSFSHQKFIL
jgi:hypothetical protein